MLHSALFAIIEEAGTAVMILGEEVARDEFMASRLTRAEVQRQLTIMIAAVASVPAPARDLMPELEWAGWSKLGRELQLEAAQAEDALWFALHSLVPATLMWLQVYRRQQPELFTFNC
jgi:uncharacterized protein with HEPN domain